MVSIVWIYYSAQVYTDLWGEEGEGDYGRLGNNNSINMLRRQWMSWAPLTLSLILGKMTCGTRTQQPSKKSAFTAWDGILGHQFNKRLESFAPSYSQSLLQADFKENDTLIWYLKSSQKICVTRIEFCRMEKQGKKTRQHLESKARVYAQKPRLKMPSKNSISAI